jgi:hypothetical protein
MAMMHDMGINSVELTHCAAAEHFRWRIAAEHRLVNEEE